MKEMQEIWVWSLDWEDTLDGGTTTHSSILDERIPWTEELVSYKPQGQKEPDTAQVTDHTHTGRNGQK